MTEKIRFTKMHGCGNDYIYINMMEQKIADPQAAAIAWSDRHKGIGSDGLVLIGASTVPEADFSMRIFNADGSEVAVGTAKSLASAANGDNMGKVIDAEKTCTMNGQSGYIYEVTYTAVDYFGKVAIRKYYVKF